ncbi:MULTISPECIES: hypothetical protein [unclassified Colwellia]|uniref:hypothetical protein n=1 Tax=unclassified Colwellia TaxID=196834 RepID=UPI0015F49A2B|nr:MULTISPECIES: hypothetical protein [unclassified Colwellia]MBA6255004.1 hypothetical protein [Colwellia sp. MB3u-28]MBA6259045.1 hypothetical protein [Colwellia sp. MB3u-41]
MLFGQIEINIQNTTLLIAFLAIVFPFLLNILARKDKKKELRQKSIELLISLENHQDKSSFEHIYAKNDCLRTMTDFKGDVSFYEHLKKFKDPIKSLETYKKFGLRINDFPENAKLKNRLEAVFKFLLLFTLSSCLLPILSQTTFNNYSTLSNELDKSNKKESKGLLQGKMIITSKSEWVIDANSSTLSLNGRPVISLDKVANNLTPPTISISEASPKEPDQNSKKQEINIVDYFSEGKKFIHFSVLIISVILSFIAQIFLFVLIIGSLIKAMDYLLEPSDTIRKGIEFENAPINKTTIKSGNLQTNAKEKTKFSSWYKTIFFGIWFGFKWLFLSTEKSISSLNSYRKSAVDAYLGR